LSNADRITPDLLLRAYCSGVFPMSEGKDNPEIFWVDPEARGIIPLDGFHISRSLRKHLLTGNYRFTINLCFDRVLKACAARETTWINTEIRALYNALHHKGFAHSVEVWGNNGLIGGLYGVAIGSAFFGESMFSHAKDGSKLALVALLARLRFGGFTLLDTQFLTEHLASMGGIEIPREAYHESLEQALNGTGDFWRLPVDTTDQEFLQLSTQTS